MPKRGALIGLDLGAHSVKAAWVSLRAGGPQVTRTESLHIPLNEQDPDRLIRPWLESNGISRQPCALAIPGADTVFQSFQLAPDDPRTPTQAAGMEVDKFNDIASESMTYGFAAFVRKGATKAAAGRRLLLMMTRPAVLDGLLGRAEALGLHVADLVPAPAALYNLAQATASTPGEIDMVVNAGHTRTEVAVGSSDGMLFARSFRTGGLQVTEALRRGGGLSPSQADTFKMTRLAREEDPEARARIAPAVDLWINEIRNCLNAFRHQIRDPDLMPKRIILAGGAALLDGLVGRLGEAVELPVVPAGNVFAGVLPKKAELFTPAAGLAVTALEAGPLRISLLPEYARHELVFREKKPYWIASGVAVALAVGILIIGGVRTIGRQSAELQAAADLVSELERLAGRIEQREAIIQRLRRQSEPVSALLHMGPRYRDLINLVAESLDPQDWIAMICDEYSYYAPADELGQQDTRRRPGSIRPGMRDPRLAPVADEPEKPETAKPPPPLPVRFIVEGYTPKDNLATVQDLIRRLMESDMVVKADLIYDDRKVPPDRFRTWATDARHQHFVVLVEMESL